jgi:hypothetical protein
VEEDLRPDADLRQVITWAIHRDVITVDEAQLLTISYLPARPAGAPTTFGPAAPVSELRGQARCLRGRPGRSLTHRLKPSP